MTKIEVVLENSTTLGEGPHYDDGYLYYVDIIACSVGRYDTRSGNNVSIKVRNSHGQILCHKQLQVANCRFQAGPTSAS